MTFFDFDFELDLKAQKLFLFASKQFNYFPFRNICKLNGLSYCTLPLFGQNIAIQNYTNINSDKDLIKLLGKCTFSGFSLLLKKKNKKFLNKFIVKLQGTLCKES